MLTPIDGVTTWSVNIGLQYPILQGGTRQKQLQQTRIRVLQLEDQLQNTRNQLEMLVRMNIETVGVSVSRMNLAREAAEASRKNFEIIQNAYNEGQANITTLIDAQNNALQTELNAANAVYTFILDFLNLERSIGTFYFMAEPAEKDAFFERMNTFFKQ